MLPSLPANAEHPWPSGHIFQSPGAHLTYRVVGPCCRLYDRERLPWPCCRLQWRGKEPSWRRIGRRFIADLSTRRHASYCVEVLGQGYRSESFVTTLYTAKLSPEVQAWWHTKRGPQTASPAEIDAVPIPAYAATTATAAASAVVAKDTSTAHAPEAEPPQQTDIIQTDIIQTDTASTKPKLAPKNSAPKKSAQKKSAQKKSEKPAPAAPPADETQPPEPPSYPQLSLL